MRRVGGTLWGLRASVALLMLFGVVEALWLLDVLLLGVLPVAVERQGGLPKDIVYALWLAAMVWLALRAARAMTRGRRWAAYALTWFGLEPLIVGGYWGYGMYADLRVGIPVHWERVGEMVVLVAVGLWCCVYLYLPHGRAEMRRLREAEAGGVSGGG